MKNLYGSILFSILFFYGSTLSAANRYWVATGSSNWNSTSNWSSSSGGSGGASVPGSSDKAYFNASGNGNCGIDATVDVSGISISGYSGTISQNTYSVTTGSSIFTMSSGTFLGGTGSINATGQFYLTGGSFQSTSGTFTSSVGDYNAWRHTGGTFSHNNGSVVFTGNNPYLTTASTSFHNVTFNGGGIAVFMAPTNGSLTSQGTLTFSGKGIVGNNGAYTIKSEGDIVVNSSYHGGYGGVALLITGSQAVQEFSLTGTGSNMDHNTTINKSSGEVKLLSDLTLDRSNQKLTLTSGTLNANGKTLTCLSGTALNEIIVNGNSNISGGGNIIAYRFTQSSGSTTFTDGGSFRVDNIFTQTTGTFTANTTSMDLKHLFYINGGTFNAPSTTLKIKSGGIYNSATFNHNSGTTLFGGQSGLFSAREYQFYDAYFDGTGVGYALDPGYSYIVIQNFLSLDGYVVYANECEKGFCLNPKGNVTVEPSYNPNDNGGVMLCFICNAVQEFDLTGAEDRFRSDIYINKPGGEVKLMSDLDLQGGSFQGIFVQNGTLNLNGYDITTNSGVEIIIYNGGNIVYNGGTISGTTVEEVDEDIDLDLDDCTPDEQLPVEMLYFHAEKKGNDALLSWATASEENNDFFSVEKSIDGRNYLPVGNVKGAGNSLQMNTYSFTDNNLRNDVVYYRLKQTDFDGQFEYSNVVVLKKLKDQLGAKNIDLYPNPNTGMVNIDLHSDIRGTSTVKILNSNGLVVLEKDVDLTIGTNKLEFDLELLPRGMYFVSFEGINGPNLSRFVLDK